MPALIGFLLIFIGGIRIQASSNSGKISIPFICLLMTFLGIWTFLSSITNFHLHALTNFGMQIYTLVMTVGYPLSLLVYILQRLKNITSEPIRGKEQNRFRPLSIWIGGLLFLVGSGLLIGLQFWSSTVVPSLGYDTMFPFEVQWSWQLSHWPGWLWIGTCCLTITFGTHIMTQRWIVKESTTKPNSNSNLAGNQNSSLFVLKRKNVDSKSTKSNRINHITYIC